ncbi:arabinan endo-1,5-alpha-L-arabinosidase [uncultured Bacteroides sp.]|uniref:arabinan endo-1,5-alpha-L-arabinosidase n=1 Tax=uncultured Bacteroides sp. TaxID=162156 RepID=UPI00374A801B
MKIYRNSSFRIILMIFAMIVMLSCKSSAPLRIISNPNPWPDNYTPFSGMENYKKWGTYNVHDPACKKFGDTYYMYSTDAIFAENKDSAKKYNVPLGYIQVRKSKDLVNWTFVGWAFPEIPSQATDWVRSNSGGKGATNIWAPFIIHQNNVYRLYYCVSAFGEKTSYIGLAESSSPEGPWIQKGCVVRTNRETPMNAIDPTVIVNPENGETWMHYGSFFGGIYCVQLNPETGVTMKSGDLGHLVARRANYKKDNMEAPEIVYNPQLKKYYLFVSYDPLMTTYNVRVGRSDNPEGPFTDYAGKAMADTTDILPILTAPYRFDNHAGWAGTAHCGICSDGEGRYFMFHQGRLSPHNLLMVLHAREMFFTPDGWPVVSPERYTGTSDRKIQQKDLVGEWEVIRIQEPGHERQLEAGQILWGEGMLHKSEQNSSFHIKLTSDKNITGKYSGTWNFETPKSLTKIVLSNEEINNLVTFAAHDWENQTETILFTGLDKNGRTVWGKRVK